ncbi:MAG: hypothetical protein CVV59_01100 [Tenericutes bacterium HGW-Tenericutes-4]|nr:MAG: hypothetical protein CVV59_01100 [Tenericutes bacterium HGW-Tenericutes-4]
MRKNFYVFLNIDAVLLDPSLNILNSEKSNAKNGATMQFNTVCVEALKFLFEELTKHYDVNLVISSDWKSDMAQVISALYEHDLMAVKKVEATRNSSFNIRGLEIKDYLKDKEDKENFLIIDNETTDIVSFVNKDKILKTVSNKDVLNKKQIENYLVKLGLMKKGEKNLQDNLVKDELILG